MSDECTNHLLAAEQVSISHILLAVFNWPGERQKDGHTCWQ